MVNLLDKEYFHLGTNNIKSELWIDLYEDQFHDYNIKPGGCLWCSTFDNNLGDWVNYLRMTAKENFDYVIANKNCSLVKFKNNTRFLKIENESDIKNLYDSGLIIPLPEPVYVNVYHNKARTDYILDYDKIKQNYDLMYMGLDLNKESNSSFQLYRVKTMLALNPNAIEYFKPLDVDFYYDSITKIYDKKTVSKPCKDYYAYINYINELFDKEIFTTKDELYKVKEKIINFISNDLKKQSFNFPSLDKDLLINNNVNNAYYKRKKLLDK